MDVKRPGPQHVPVDEAHALRERTRRIQNAAPSGTDVRRPGAEGIESTKAALARRVSELRRAKNMTASELARRAEVSAAMISQIERGNATPSVATLVGLANALDTTIASFFDKESEPGRVVRRTERGVIDYPAIGVRDELVAADPTGRLQVLESRIAPGVSSGVEPFTHGSEAECVLVLEGSITILLGDERVCLAVGDTVTFSGRVPHGFENEGEVDALLIWIITPASY